MDTLEATLRFLGSLIVSRPDGPGTTVDLTTDTRLVYGHVRIASAPQVPRESVIHEAECMLVDLGEFIAGRREEGWVEYPGTLDGPAWRRKVAEQIADALLAQQPELSLS